MSRGGGKKDPPTAGPPSSTPSGAALGPFAADCANSALKEEVKKLYAAIFKGNGSKEGA